MKAIYIDLPCMTLKDKSGKTFDLWLNSYNERVYEALSPQLSPEISDWLRIKTRPIGR